MHRILLLISIMLVSCVRDESEVKPSGNATTPKPDTHSPAPEETQDTPPPQTEVSSVGEDPLASEAWHLRNTGQKSFSMSSATANEDIKVHGVHYNLNYLGRGIRVAVSDSGTEITHPDLAGNTLSGLHRNYTSATPAHWHGSSPMPTDGEGHGTSVSGLIAALGWNGIGSRGVAPEAKFASFFYLHPNRNTETSSSRLAKKIDQLYGDFDIFNFSYGYSGIYFVQEEPTVEEALELGVTTLRDGKGAIYIQAAGNSFKETYTVSNTTVKAAGNTNAHSDLATPYKIVAGAVNAQGVLSTYSTPGSSVWITAPGGQDGIMEPAMVTTDISGCNAGYSFTYPAYPLFDFGKHALNKYCNYTNRMNGTSSAAPVTSGVVALMLEANPDLTWRDVKHILAMTADPIDNDPLLNTLTHPWGLNLSGHTYDEKWTLNDAKIWFSNWYGFGRINALAAVQKAENYDPTTLGTFVQTRSPSGEWYYDSGTLTGKTIPDNSSTPVSDRIWVGHNLVIESVQIEISSNHQWPGELGIVLVSPKNTRSRLLTINSYIIGELDETIMLSNAFYGETSEGEWRIEVVDGGLASTGSLLNWKININGHRPNSELLNPWPPTKLTLGAVPAALTESPVFSFTASTSHATVTRYEAAIGTDPSNETVQGWTSLDLSTSNQKLTGLTLQTDETYYLKVRAVNADGSSSVQVKSWTTDP
jgi:subtilisin family serine protease